MALIMVDGMDVGDFTVKWPSTAPGGDSSYTSSTTTRYGAGRSILLTGGASTGRMFTFPAVTQVFFGAAVCFPAGIGNNQLLSLSGDSGSTVHLSLVWVSGSAIALYRGPQSAQIAVGPAVAPQFGTWGYLEVSATISDTVGTCEVRWNGVTVISFTGDTKNAGTNSSIDAIALMRPNANVHYDDFYLCDASGSSPFNTFLGEIRVQTLSPTGAGASTQWTPDTGSNYARVNEIPYSAANYAQDSTSGHRDTYAMADLSATPGTILAVQNNLILKRTDASAISVKPAIKSGATVYYGSSYATTATDTVARDLRTVDPATSAAWTASGVNALEAGQEVA